MAFLIDEYIISGIYVGLGIVLGLVSERVILQKLKHITSLTTWKTDNVIIHAFHRMAFLWWVLAGTYFGIHHLSLNESYLSVCDKIIFSIGVLSATIVASRILVGFIKIKTEDADSGPLPSTSIITNIVRIAVFVTGVLIILQSLGISITPLLTALGVGGLAVALALQETLSNLFSGIQVIASRQIKTGDYIKLDSGQEGFVTDITWRNTTIKMLTNNLIIVPNKKIATSIITNYYLPEKEINTKMEVGVSYDSDLEKVERITIEVAKEVLQQVEGGVKNSEPSVHFHTFADSSINFSVSFKVLEFNYQSAIKHAFIKALHKRYTNEGIEIPFPVRTVYLKNETN